MEKLLARQAIIAEAIKKVAVNVKKDGGSRKTVEYANKRLEILRTQWQEFDANNSTLAAAQDKSDSYFTTDLFKAVKIFYETTQTMLINIARDPGTMTKGEKSGEATESNELSVLLDKQRTNFRAFMRVVQGIRSSTLTEKWEVEDKLQMLQSRWKIVDDTHWQIDNANIGADVDYEQEFTEHETTYESTKKELNKSLNSSRHIHQAVPQIEIPTFSGNYAQWPTFLDLYTEAIHQNSNLTKAQKMQHLKGKLKGEAERLVQHLNISADNYDTCWDLLIRRYNNLQLLFTKQIQLFMRQPVIQKQDAVEIKRLHDITMESINAIHNLGIDTTTWDPILVHIVTEKMDPDTYTAYMEARKNPRELPSFDELITFLENRFTALEPVDRKPKTGHSTKPYLHQAQEKPFKPFFPKAYHATCVKTCPFCKAEHILLHCTTFQGMTPDEKMRTISRLDICVNCMYCHNGKKCNSNKRCRVCSDPHHTSLHDVAKESSPPCNTIPNKPTSALTPKSNHVSGNFDEVLLATVEIEVKANDGTYTRLRCLLDQGSQINLITESAAQRLGLQRQRQAATISGIGITAAKSNGVVQLLCRSMYGDYNFTTEALVMSKMLNNLPNATFDKQSWPHLHNINLADPDYNISRPVDILLDAGVYAEIVMEGVLRGPIHAPIAQQTKIGWVLMGNVKTFNCNVVMANIEEISQFWEIEEITDVSQPQTSDVDYCKALYQQTTRRRPEGRYEVRIPMKPDFNQELGESKPQAIAQFRQMEKRLARDQALSESYKTFINDYLMLGHMKETTRQRRGLVNGDGYLANKVFGVLDDRFAEQSKKDMEPTDYMGQIQPPYPYIAFNLQKDDAIFLTETDLTSCLHDVNYNKLCSIDKPIHNLRIPTICDVTIVDMDITQSHMGERITLPCEDWWIRLHRRNVWLFCCEERKMRIFCTTGSPVVRSMSGSGIITITVALLTNEEAPTSITTASRAAPRRVGDPE